MITKGAPLVKANAEYRLTPSPQGVSVEIRRNGQPFAVISGSHRNVRRTLREGLDQLVKRHRAAQGERNK